MEMSENCTVALKYLKLGWSIIPIQNKRIGEIKAKKTGKSINNSLCKTPLIDWKQYQSKLPTKNEIINWWTKYPDANIGLVTGNASGVNVIDFDTDESFEDFKNVVYDMVEYTLISKTERGYHVFYNSNYNLGNKTAIVPKMDLRAEGGYVVLPPSINIHNVKYKWLKSDPTIYGLEELADMPDEVHKFITENTNGNSKLENREDWLNESLKGVSEGLRNTTAAKLAGHFLRVAGMTKQSTIALLKKWNKLNNPPLEYNVLKATVDSIDKRYVIPEKKSNGSRIKDTILSNIKNMDTKNKKAYIQKKIKYSVENLKNYFSNINIIQYPDANDDMYRVVSSNGRYIDITSKNLFSSNNFFSNTLNITHKAIEPLPTQIWIPVINEFLKLSEVKNISDEETVISPLREIILKKIDNYIKDEPYKDDSINHEYMVKRYCFTKELDHDTFYLKTSSLMSWIENNPELKKLERKEICKLLSNLGFIYSKKTTRIKDKTGKFWSCAKETILKHQ